jgi:hypothetical protein
MDFMNFASSRGGRVLLALLLALPAAHAQAAAPRPAARPFDVAPPAAWV